MMENNMRDDVLMDLDLNQEPLDPPSTAVLGSGSLLGDLETDHDRIESLDHPRGAVLGLGSLLGELETAHDRIEERIRQLEAVTARARQRQRWREARNRPEAIPEVSTISIVPMGNPFGVTGTHNGESSVGALGSTSDRGKGCKRDSTHLVAKALEMDMDIKRVSGDGGKFFDCNICLDTAREPVLTCCGHLFCWACFYQLPYIFSDAKECPVCKGEVIDGNVTPIYGNGNDTHMSGLESDLKVPPRPQAHRKESVRQQHVNRVVSHIPVAEALRRIRTGIGAMREHPQRRNLVGIRDNSDRTNILASQDISSEVLPEVEAGGSRHLRPHQFSRVLSESAASLSSISSALNDAERLFEDVESYIHNRVLRRSAARLLPIYGGDIFTSNAASDINSTESLSSASVRTDVSAAVVNMENLTTEINQLPHLSSSSRRRSGSSRVSDLDSAFSREPRRRRLG